MSEGQLVGLRLFALRVRAYFFLVLLEFVITCLSFLWWYLVYGYQGRLGNCLFWMTVFLVWNVARNPRNRKEKRAMCGEDVQTSVPKKSEQKGGGGTKLSCI